MTKTKRAPAKVEATRPSPMHVEMADFNIRSFFSILFGRHRKTDK